MGKKKSKPSGSSAASVQGKSATKLPKFDESALSALTARIEKGLGSTNISNEPGEINSRLKKNMKKDFPAHSEQRKSKHSQTATVSRGVKRDANGNAKLDLKNKNVVRGSKEGGGGDKEDRAVLLQEILALGGTAEDLDMVADVVSDDDAEFETDAQVDRSFQKDLARFVAGLGIEKQSEREKDAPADNQLEEGDLSDAALEALEDSSSDISDVQASKDYEDLKYLPKAAAKEEPLTGNSSRLIFAARPDWHATVLPDLPTPEVDEVSRSKEAITNLKTYALSLLEADSNIYASKHLSASSSHRFLSTIMSSGTLSDKVSALTLVVQESPVHTTKSFESLLVLAKKRSRGQAVSALGALKDLLAMGVVLPPDRRLRTFSTQPGLVATLQTNSVSTWKIGQPLPGSITKSHLISWVYEDWLKESYFDMLKVLEGWCNDEVEYARSRAVTYVYELLKEKPEQEANLLRLLVNKLGDPDKKIASRTSYLLLQLQISHPLMKQVIISSVETELLLRPGQSLHAKYYAINTLNQTILSIKDDGVAQKLLDIYFELFVALLKKPDPPKALDAPALNRKGQVQGGGGTMGKKAKFKAAKEDEAKLAGEETTEKMISAVLTGVNRAFPFSNTNDLTLEAHMDTLFRITHSSNFNTSVQALILIEQLATSKHLAVERFYRTLYESLLDPRLITSSKHALYLNLLFRALRSDVNIKRVKAFVKRLLQIVNLHQPPFICGVLFLLRELETILPALRTLYSETEDRGDEGEETFRDVPESGVQTAPSLPSTAVAPHETYDGRKRDPEYSHADKSCLWETLPFLAHFHPSVSLFADRLLSNEKMPPKPDLASHNLTSFLDRFVYRNAKSAAGGPRGGSIMQPLSGGDNKGALLSARGTVVRQEPLNTEAFWRKKVDDVAVDEVFFHRYFNQIGKSKRIPSKKVATKESDAPDGDDDENEDEIWQALVDSRPELEGPSDDDSDIEMLDLEDSDAASADWSDADSDVDIEGEDSKFADLEGSEDESAVSGGSGEDDENLDDLFSKELQNSRQETDDKTGEETSRQRKKRMKSLPTFASIEDYADMLDNDEDEDL